VEYGIEKFKEDYWESKGNPSEEEKTSESKRTRISYNDQLRKLEKYNDLELTPELLRTVIEEKSSPNTKPRQDMCKIFKRLGKLFFIESDLKDLDKIRGKYIPKKRTRVFDAIVEEIDKIREHQKYGWLTAAVFIYGCRPNEAFTIIPQKDGIAKAVNSPKAEEKAVKFPIALGELTALAIPSFCGIIVNASFGRHPYINTAAVNQPYFWCSLILSISSTIASNTLVLFLGIYFPLILSRSFKSLSMKNNLPNLLNILHISCLGFVLGLLFSSITVLSNSGVSSKSLYFSSFLSWSL
jgi:hypothetical protein